MASSYSLTNSVALIEAAKKGDAAAIVDLLGKNADLEFVDKVKREVFLLHESGYCSGMRLDVAGCAY